MEKNPCPRGGNKWYKPMIFDTARFPSYASKFRLDDSVGFMPPLPGSGFDEGLYW